MWNLDITTEDAEGRDRWRTIISERGGEEKTHYDVDWRKTSVVKENRYDNNYRYV